MVQWVQKISKHELFQTRNRGMKTFSYQCSVSIRPDVYQRACILLYMRVENRVSRRRRRTWSPNVALKMAAGGAGVGHLIIGNLSVKAKEKA